MFKPRLLIASIAFACNLGGAALAQPPMSADDFVSASAQSDLYEIQAGRLILTQSTDPRVRTLAQQLINDHQQTSQDLQTAAAASGLMPPPTTLSGDERSLLSALQSLKAVDLDRTYAAQQVNAHAAALVTKQSYVQSGTDANLRRAAQSAVPLIQRHLQMAQQLKTVLGPN